MHKVTNDIHTVAHGSGTTYCDALALGLLIFASHDIILRRYLQNRTSQRTATLPPTTSPSPYFVPHTRTQALRRAAWLLSHTKDQRATAILAHARELDEPRAIVLGIDMGALPLGVWGKWKRKDHAMQILLPDAPLTTSERERAIVTASHRVVEQGLVRAHGNTKHLEPELGEWLFGDKALAYYKAPLDVLHEVAAFLETLDAPVAYSTTDSAQPIVALSPSLYLGDLPRHEELMHYEEASCA